MTTLADIEARFPAWHYDTPRILYSLIRAIRPRQCVEIGTYTGYAACYMALALQENNFGSLACIDDFSERMQRPCTKDEWWSNIESLGFASEVSLIHGRSEDVAWPGCIDFAYIDGWHSLKTCLADFENCERRGASMIVMDDMMTVGPRHVALLKASQGWNVLEMYTDNGLAICTPRAPRPPVNFSQELRGSLGVKIGRTKEIDDHLVAASKENGIDYGDLSIFK